MNSHVGCRLRGNIWSAAGTFFGGRARKRTPFHTKSTVFMNTLRQVGSDNLTIGHFSPPSGPCRLPGIRGFAFRSCVASWGGASTAVSEQSTSTYASKVKRILTSKTATLDRRKISNFVNVNPQRQIHSSSPRTRYGEGKRNKSSVSSEQTTKKSAEETAGVTTSQTSKTPQRSVRDAATSLANKHLINRLPNLPHMHRPSKEELLAAATGFWSRLRIRFKWFSIRSVRPFNADEIGAFFSWFLLGHVLWIVLGTTTFCSLVIFAANTVFAQGKFLII